MPNINKKKSGSVETFIRKESSCRAFLSTFFLIAATIAITTLYLRASDPVIGLQLALDSHKTWLKTGGRSGHRLDLSAADLSDANLHNAKLFNANLHNAKLFNADIRGTNLISLVNR